MNEYKMTFKEWLNSEEKLFIRCRTQTQAEFLCDKLMKNGRIWRNGQSYKHIHWCDNKAGVSYSNKGTKTLYPIGVYEFKDINFEDDLDIFKWFD